MDNTQRRQTRMREVRARHLFALAAGALTCAPLTLAVGGVAAADAGDSVQPFRGVADASGMRITMHLAGATVTDTPLDGGGPTASAVADSAGGGLSYAAFPDPGQFYVGLPSLATGLLSVGAGGLPPLPVPSLPQYPFAVQADVNTGHQEVDGGGPYKLSVTSHDVSSVAEATAGFQSSVSGTAALATSNSTVRPSDHGVVATGATDVRGFSFGPLTIGRVLSSASSTLDSAGVVTPAFDLQIFGMQVGNTPVSFSSGGFSYGGAPQPVDMSQAQKTLLDNAGIRLELVQPEKLKGGTTSPALRVTLPLDGSKIPGAADYKGTLSVTLGYAFSTMQGSGVPSPTGAASRADAAAAGPSDAGLPSATSPSGVQIAAPAVLPAGGAAPGAHPVPRVQTFEPAAVSRPASHVVRQLDVDFLYALIAGGALLAFVLGSLVTGKGLRSWSSAGS
jgi:hypothetical protein